MQKEQDREAIYRSIFFCDMDRKKADEIIDRLGGRTVTYDKGEIIIREREKLNNIGILLDGGLCKVQYYRDGTEQLVQKLVSSFVVGVEIAVSEKKTSPYDIYASDLILVMKDGDIIGTGAHFLVPCTGDGRRGCSGST